MKKILFMMPLVFGTYSQEMQIDPKSYEHLLEDRQVVEVLSMELYSYIQSLNYEIKRTRDYTINCPIQKGPVAPWNSKPIHKGPVYADIIDPYEWLVRLEWEYASINPIKLSIENAVVLLQSTLRS